ncbi:MAG: GIY-YIG nuclease family protein [Rickettsiales bacterium]|jgi:predicted GIY-YIG superfamily endonuclease|nr:GIY-YIG nuclease family protein [Rickettsiales bacterium]
MYYVYLIKSVKYSDRHYIGFTENLKQRMKDHNSGFSLHTKKYMPWKLVTYLAFSNKYAALDFESYIKKGSVQAFANKRLWTSEI